MKAHPPRWPVVLWDFDGTIVDSVRAIIDTHHVATERVLGMRLDEHEIRCRIGEPAHRRIAELVPERADDVYAAYCEAFDALPPDRTPIFPGVAPILDDLVAAGSVNALVTSRPRDHVLDALEHFGLREAFATIVALDDTVQHKPHPEPLFRAVGALGAPLAHAVYIGDAVVDLESAAAAGIDSIAVTWGAGSLHDLEAQRPTTLVTTPSELASALGTRGEAAA